MILSRENDILEINVENDIDWIDLFDKGDYNEIMFEIEEETLDLFFPGWESYIDKDRPFETLRKEDGKIKTIRIQLSPDLKHLGGDGIYEVVEYRCDLADEAYRDEFGLEPTYDEFLHLTGTVYYKVTPDLPLP